MKRNIDEPSRLLLDPQSEKDLLNAIVANGGKPFETHDLTVELFANPPMAQVFLAAKAIYDLGVDLTTMALANMLNQRDQLENVGGHAFVSTLGAYCPSPEPFFTNLHEAQRRRKLRKLAQMIDSEIGTMVEVDAMIADIQAELAGVDPASRGEHVLPAMAERVLARLQRIREGHVVRGEATGFPWWEHYFGGLVGGAYYGLAARPGMGKSAIMEQMMANLLMKGVPVCCFAQDMAPDILIERMACRLARVPKWHLDHGRATGEEIDEVQANVESLRDSALRLHCIERLTGEQMITVARRELRKNKVQHFFLDHVQTIMVPKGQERNEAWAEASGFVRKFVNSNNVSWVSLCHLNREAAKEKVGGHQIRGFDDLLGDVDGLVLLDSQKVASDLEPGEDWEMSMIVDKNRNGPAGSKPVVFERTLMSFTTGLTK